MATIPFQTVIETPTADSNAGWDHNGNFKTNALVLSNNIGSVLTASTIYTSMPPGIIYAQMTTSGNYIQLGSTASGFVETSFPNGMELNIYNISFYASGGQSIYVQVKDSAGVNLFNLPPLSGVKMVMQNDSQGFQAWFWYPLKSLVSYNASTGYQLAYPPPSGTVAQSGFSYSNSLLAAGLSYYYLCVSGANHIVMSQLPWPIKLLIVDNQANLSSSGAGFSVALPNASQYQIGEEIDILLVGGSNAMQILTYSGTQIAQIGGSLTLAQNLRMKATCVYNGNSSVNTWMLDTCNAMTAATSN